MTLDEARDKALPGWNLRCMNATIQNCGDCERSTTSSCRTLQIRLAAIASSLNLSCWVSGKTERIDMTADEVIGKIQSTTTMPELDALRTEAAEAMMSDGKETFDRVQGAFRKAKNRLKRVPLRDRTW